MDNWFLREAGALNGAPWHHDEPYFDFAGGSMCAVWIPLEDATAAEGLTFIAGSHRDFPLFAPKNFKLDEPFDGVGADYAAMPDFDDPAFDERRLSWEMAAGDCLVFDLRTVHGASAGRKPLAKTIRRLSLRYGDQDVRFHPRGPWTEETAGFLIDAGQRPDAPLDCPMLPRVWPPGATVARPAPEAVS
jgi:ectoine hydroxylase-related dioxygenase (phytanoyl-CoA dioxygenase family)